MKTRPAFCDSAAQDTLGSFRISGDVSPSLFSSEEREMSPKDQRNASSCSGTLVISLEKVKKLWTKSPNFLSDKTQLKHIHIYIYIYMFLLRKKQLVT